MNYIDQNGTFRIHQPEETSYLYFPIADENGVMSSVTPTFGGDSKLSQDEFLLEPVTSESLHASRASRNFWVIKDGEKCPWSAVGASDIQQAQRTYGEGDEVTLEGGLLYQSVERRSSYKQLTSKVTAFVPHTDLQAELLRIEIRNDADRAVLLQGFAAIPIYGRSADNIRDHRSVTSMLSRISTCRSGVINTPTLTFDERGHHVNRVSYGVFGGMECEADPKGMLRFPKGFYPTVDSWIGEGGSLTGPKALADGIVMTVRDIDEAGADHGESCPTVHDGHAMYPAGVRIDGFEAMGGLAFEPVQVDAGESVTFYLALAYGRDAQMEEKADALLGSTAFDRLFAEANRRRREENAIAYQSGDSDFNLWMKWVNFQPTLRKIYGCSFLPHHDYGRGGRGWRDLWQDCLALLVQNPKAVRSLLKSNFAGVRLDGTNATIIGAKEGEFKADRNGIPRVWMDHGMWPFLTVKLYLDQTGDLEFLLEKQPYFKDALVERGDGRDEAWSEEQGCMQKDHSGKVYGGTLIEHLLLENVIASMDLGAHGNIRLRGADWNDALDMGKDQGESIPFTAMYAYNMKELAKVLGRMETKLGLKELPLLREFEMILAGKTMGDYCMQCRHTIDGAQRSFAIHDLIDHLNARADAIMEHIREKEWIPINEEAGFYRGYYDNDGNSLDGYDPEGAYNGHMTPVSEDERRMTTNLGHADIMLTGQVFTVMSGVADDAQVRKITRAADWYLDDPTVGGYRLNTDFKEVKLNMGRMFGFAYGQKENGAVFCHMAVMYANALYRRGFAREGYRVIHELYSHVNDFERAHIYPGVPEYIDPSGRGVYHYLTGAGSWLLITVLNEMFGVQGRDGDLYLRPQLVKEQFTAEGVASVNLIFADRKLKVTYHNEKLLEAGAYRIGEIMVGGVRITQEESGCIGRDLIESLDAAGEHEIVAELVAV